MTWSGSVKRKTRKTSTVNMVYMCHSLVCTFFIQKNWVLLPHGYRFPDYIPDFPGNTCICCIHRTYWCTRSLCFPRIETVYQRQQIDLCWKERSGIKSHACQCSRSGIAPVIPEGTWTCNAFRSWFTRINGTVAMCNRFCTLSESLTV